MKGKSFPNPAAKGCKNIAKDESNNKIKFIRALDIGLM